MPFFTIFMIYSRGFFCWKKNYFDENRKALPVKKTFFVKPSHEFLAKLLVKFMKSGEFREKFLVKLPNTIFGGITVGLQLEQCSGVF